MDHDERQMIADLFERMRSVQNLDKDGDAEAFIHQSMRQNGDSPYLLVQSVLAQEVALQEAGKRIEELEAQRAGSGASGGRQSAGFAGGAAAVPTGSAAPWEAPSDASSTAAGVWGAPPSGPAANTAAASAVPAAGVARSSSVPAAGAASRARRDDGGAPSQRGRGGGGGGFMAQAMTTAAGVAGGMLLANSIGSLFGGSSTASDSTPSTASTETAPATTDAQQANEQTSDAADQSGVQEAAHDDDWGDDAGWGGDDDFGIGDFDI